MADAIDTSCSDAANGQLDEAKEKDKNAAGGGGNQNQRMEQDTTSALRNTLNIVRLGYALKNKRWQFIQKHSRDITQKSKSVIGILQENFSNYINGRRLDSEHIMTFCENRLNVIQLTHFKCLFLICEEMTLRQVRNFHRAMSPGIEEFIEAVGLYKMMKFQDVLSFEDVKDLFTFVRSADAIVPANRFDGTVERHQQKIRLGRLLVTYSDYIGGVSDCTGELMKVCMRASSESEKEFFLKALILAQTFHTGMIAIPNHSKRVKEKISAIKMNVMKLELHAVEMTLNPSG